MPSNQSTPRAVESASAAGGNISSRFMESVDIKLDAYLGSASMTVGEFAALGRDSVISLNAMLNQTVELRLNGLVVARGELVAVGDKFGVKITEISK